MLEGSILQKLETAHRGSQRPLNLGVYYKNTLVALCHALEDFVLQARSAPVIIAAFQRGKWYMQEAERYGQLAERASQIAILATAGTGFAEHPTSQRSNVSLVGLTSDDPVAQEWHLMILSPTYTAMVLCQELSDADYGSFGPPENDLERKFYGFWTFEPDLVWETVEIAIAHVGGYDGDLQRALKQQLEEMKAAFGTQERENVGLVVSRVVDYLQTSQQDLHQPEEQQASYLPHSQALGDNLLSNEMQAFLRMAQLIDQADVTNPNAAAEVTALTEAMGQILDLPAWQLKRLRLASLLHRLAPSLARIFPASPEERQEQPEERQEQPTDNQPLSCPLDPGIQALRVMPRMGAVARIITHQPEHWDGTGVPGGLAYDAIPLESRILALVADFQWRVNHIRVYRSKQGKTPSREETLSQALAECKEQAGKAFDPKLVEVLELLVMGMQQGMSIEASKPKIAAGVWLIDSHPEEEAQLSAMTNEA
jgi:DICT domain-containing protein